MKPDSSYPTIRTHLIAISVFLLGIYVYGGFLACCTVDPSSWLCLGAVFIAFFSYLIADKLAQRLHRGRFIRVPRYSEPDVNEKPKCD